jgi:hypothetical protein
MSICHDYDDTFFGIVTVAALPSARGTASGVALQYGDYCPVTSRAAGYLLVLPKLSPLPAAPQPSAHYDSQTPCRPPGPDMK